MNPIDILRYGSAALFLVALGFGIYRFHAHGDRPPAGWRQITASGVLMFTSPWIRNDWIGLAWAVAAVGLMVWGYVVHLRASAQAGSPRSPA